MILILDANVLVSDPLLRGSIWHELADAISGGRVEVMIPQLALQEAIAVYQRAREAKAIEINSVGRRASQAVKLHLKAAESAAVREGRAYPKQIKKRLLDVGISLLDPPKTDHAQLAERAIQRRRPFDDGGSGYRDALHWASVLEVVEARYEETDIVFVSADKRAFGGVGKAGDQLHADLLEDLAALDAAPPWFSWLQTIGQFSVPGLFYEEVQPGSEIVVTPGEVSGYLQAALWELDIWDLLPHEVEGQTAGASVRVIDIGEPLVAEVDVQQYWERWDYRASFTMTVEVTLAVQVVTYPGSTVDIEEETVSVVYYSDGHLHVTRSQGEIGFDDLELGRFTELHA